ncbi:stage II sporulation protein D [Emergencia sp. 1XD21-10]|uniref:stage II sporulation protein D n=1 Tax=Emergencia sp. 1XD21-10 TaxID=2304569 RepID=UPI00137AC628|nr:stage II sporulation protein D [Emergencia sp. 1XD21-10]NCF00245.1 stage II sporulation protein D [Emergencia sp. 1XD21-10]
MFHHGKLNRQHAVIYFVSMVILMVVLPYLSIKLFPALVKDLPETSTYDGEIPDTVRIYLTKEDKYETIAFEDYIEGVVASEMPASFEYEALKAQAVASRTYALGRILAGTEICDSVHCQVYRSDNIDEKVSKAVEETCGQVLLYKGKLAAHALYFASSAGPTENSQDVFSGTYAYLVSVDSSYEPGATHKKEKTTMTISAFSKAIKKAFPEKNFGTIKKSNIKIKSRSEGGRVATAKVGKETITGSDIRTALSLYSTRFEISFSGNTKITITTAGSGHGVGMSQYGANGLAKKGKTYKKILSHYYRGTSVSTGESK